MMALRAGWLLVPFLIGLACAQSWMQLPGNIYGISEGSEGFIGENWPVSNVGQPLKPQTPDAEVKEMLAAVDANRIKTIVTTLANFGTRHTLSLSNQTHPVRGIGAARD